MELERLLSSLIQVRSMSGQEGELASLIRDELNSMGVDQSWIDEVGNVIAKVTGHSDSTIVFDGHMDTVPAGEGWSHDPFSGKSMDGHIYGRGSVDMKGGIAAMLHSIKQLKEVEPTIYYAFVVHEEDQEGFGISHFLSTLRRKPSLVVLGEPTSLKLAIGHRGRAEIVVTIRGRAAHSSMPDLGDNCLYHICDFLKTLAKTELPYHPSLGRASIAPVSVRCSPGIVPVIPDKCEVLLDRRVVLGESKQSILGGLPNAKIVKRRILCYTGFEEEVEAWFPAWLNESPLVRELSRVLGVDTMVWRFGTDGSYTAGVEGIFTIGYGPGDQEMAHRANEMVSIKEVRKAIEGYVKIIEWASNLQTL